jgi:hypothetical protein
MQKIKLPKDVLKMDAFKTLPAKEKEEYAGNLLNKILTLNPEGVTISQIREATGLTYSTIWHHIEILNCTAQSRKISRGNLDVYYPIGKCRHLKEYSKGKVRYSISRVDNEEGSFLCIHEIREKRSGSASICKGTLIPVELVDDIITTIKGAKKSIKKGK